MSTAVTGDGAHDSAVTVFLEQLSAMPLTEWHACAMASPCSICAAVERALAHALERTVTAFDVWRVRDDVGTLMFRFERPQGRSLLHGRDARARIQLATERASLALLARPALAEQYFHQLAGGFERIFR